MISKLNGTVLCHTPVKPEKATGDEAAKKREAAQHAGESISAPADTFLRSSEEIPITYTKPNVRQLLELEQQRVDSFTEMLRGMVVKQGQKSNLSLLGMALNVTPTDSAAAAAAIAPGGESSPEVVAERILNLAKALSGGNKAKIPLLREAVEKGFQAAGIDLGQTLPSICDDTHNQVMKGFDEWEKSLDATVGEGSAAYENQTGRPPV